MEKGDVTTGPVVTEQRELGLRHDRPVDHLEQELRERVHRQVMHPLDVLRPHVTPVVEGDP